MAKKLKVFNGTSYKRGKAMNVIVATYTKKRACELLDVSMNLLNNFFPITFNKHQIEVATANPEVVMACPDRDRYKQNPTYEKF